MVRRKTKGIGRLNSIAQGFFTAGLIVILVMVAGSVGLFVFDQVRQSIAASDILPDFTIEHEEPDQEVGWEPGEPLPRWEGTDRVNVLVMGIDQREYEQGPWRTDTMLVLTIDPVTMTGGMLSIPRDLWVPIPGFEDARINQAHFIGEVYDYPGGGPALAVKTVQYNLGIHIHYYARVNFRAFEEIVDLIGGIDVYVEEEVVDPAYPDDDTPGYDPLYIPAGWQHLDGEMALKYARTRHSAGGDFDRARRQQQVLMAVFDQVTRLDLLPQLAPRAPELWETLQGSIVTDLTLDEIIALARLASEVEPDNIHYGVIDEHYTQFWETPDGQQVLIPLRDRMRELRDYILTAQPALPAEEDPAARLAAEAATVEVLNGTTTEGLAGRTAEFIQQNGLQVAHTDNADRSDYTDSLVIVYTGKNYTADYIVGLLDLPPTAVVHGPDPSAKYDISIILGADYQPPEQSEQPEQTEQPEQPKEESGGG
jgi:LCP family protein required for cell wall assembly